MQRYVLMGLAVVRLTLIAAAAETVELKELKYSKVEGGTEAAFVLSPTAESFIRCKVFLPADWDGRLWGMGNGGWAGTVIMNRFGRSAVVGCDLGTSRRGRPVIGEKMEVLIDYSWRATHLAAVAAKQLIRERYGKLPDHSYFYGQSCGGRQGIAEALRFPEDYEGIISGVPGLVERTRACMPWKVATLRRQHGGKWFTEAEQRMVRAAELRYFAARDPEWAHGKFILDPTPTPEKLDGCWREIMKAAPALADRETLWRELFTPIVVSGRRVAPGKLLGIEFGGVSSFMVRKVLAIDEPADLTEAQMQQFLNFKELWTVGEPDFSAFRKRGGKLIMYSGTEDLSCSAAEITEFYAEAAHRLGGYDQAREFFVYYVEPGRTHGAGGEPAGTGKVGAPQNLFEKLVDWVERGQAPGELSFKMNEEPKVVKVSPYPDNRVTCVSE